MTPDAEIKPINKAHGVNRELHICPASRNRKGLFRFLIALAYNPIRQV
jgi:hypothetical protein